MGVERTLSLLTEVPRGRMQVVAVMNGNDDGDPVSFDELAERIGQKGGNATGRIACLGVHTKDVAAL